MADAPKHNSSRARPEALAKLATSRHRTDSDHREPETRLRLRSTIQGSDHSRQHQHKQHRSTRQAARDTVQSALELRPPINFDHLLRRDKRTPVPSRRNSANKVHGDGDIEKLQEQTRLLQKRVGVDDVKKSKEDNEKREHELRAALQDVEKQAMQSTRELDNTYYILLEKAETLRGIVSNMQELAKESRDLRDDFREQSHELQIETSNAIDNFKDFVQQEQSIKSLLARLNSYKKRTAALNDRLGAARTRAEVCEKRVLNAEQQRKKRWGTTWAIMFFIVVVVLGLLIARQPPEAGGAHLSSSKTTPDMISPILVRLKSRPSEDPYLHSLFDGIS